MRGFRLRSWLRPSAEDVSTCGQHRSIQPHARKRPLVPRVSRDSKGPRIKIIARLVSEKISRKLVKLERINAASELNKVILYTSVKDFCCLCWTSAGIEQNGVAPKIILVRAPVVSVAEGAIRSLTKARTLISDILNFTQFRDFKIQRRDGNENVT